MSARSACPSSPTSRRNPRLATDPGGSPLSTERGGTMSDDNPTRRTEVPAPGTDPAAVREPAPVVDSREVPVPVTHEAPAQSAEPEGPAHRADAPPDSGRPADAAAATPAPEDPRAEVEADDAARQRDEAPT